jgi:hypothetical protein
MLINRLTILLTLLMCFYCYNLKGGDILLANKKKDSPEGRGWYLEASGGYGLPFLITSRKSPLAEIGNKDVFQRGRNDISVKYLYGTNGNGWMGNITVGHMFNKIIGIDFMFSGAMHPQVLDARIDVPGYFASQYTQTDAAMYIAPHLVMKWRGEKRFGITARTGLLLPFYGKTISRVNVRDRNGRLFESLLGLPLIPIPGNIVDITLRGSTTTKYNPTVGLSASLSFDYYINHDLKLFGQARVGVYTVSLKETVFDEVTMTTFLAGEQVNEIAGLKATFGSVEEAPEFLRRIIYRKEITTSSNTGRYGRPVNFDKPNDELGQRFNASSIYLNIGIAYQFNKKK